MKTIGFLLIAIGLIGVLWGGITYIKDRDTTHIGPVDIVVVEKDHIAIPPVVGAVALVAGGLLVGISRRHHSGPA